jgi:AAA domain-containing protein
MTISIEPVNAGHFAAMDKVRSGNPGKSAKPRNKRGNGQIDQEPFPFTMSKDITLDPKVFLIDGFLGRHETSVWYGPPDAGKSTVKIDAMACVAAGKEYCGRRVSQGPVLYVAAERGAIVKRRIKAWCIEHGLPDIPLAVIDHAVDLRTGKVDANRIIATAEALAAIYKQPVTWISFDTLNRVLAGGDENSSKDMGAVIASIDYIQRATQAHVSAIHHVPVDRTDRMRGHGSVLGAMDMTVRTTKDSNNIVNVEVDKANDLVDRPCFAFKFKSVALCIDEKTDVETTAPVMVPVEGKAITGHAEPKLTKNQQTAYSILRDAGSRGLSAEEWNEQLRAVGIGTKRKADIYDTQLKAKHLVREFNSRWTAAT